MIPFYSLTQADLAALLLPISFNEKRACYRAKQIYHWVYQRGVCQFQEMTDLALAVRAWLEEHVSIDRLTQKSIDQSKDGTTKFLWTLHDGKTVESVIIPSHLEEHDPLDLTGFKRRTACISSQVGCAMKCAFCVTGIQGIDRNLTVNEIVMQIAELHRHSPLTNIVFMGMGEPLNNFDAVLQACRIFLDQDGFGFSKRKITVSTSGIVPKIELLGVSCDVSLAISLNATTDGQRSAIMPVNQKWNIESLLGACRRYPLGSHRRITFEYVMLAGFNDSLDDAYRLLELIYGIPHKINLIPFNEHPYANFKRPSDATVRAFQKVLLAAGSTATVRMSRGREIAAACGQLRSMQGTAKGSEYQVRA